MRTRPVLRLEDRFEPERLVDCPECGRKLPRRRRQEAWIEVPLGRAWVAAYRLVVKAGRPLVAEVRLFPSGKARRRPGSWSGEARSVPAEGLTGRALRSLRIGDPVGLFPKFVANWERRHGTEATEQVLRRFRLSTKAPLVARRPGRAGRTEEFYATWAAAYVARIRAGSRRPIKDLAARPPIRMGGNARTASPVREATARDIVHEARQRGFLTDSPPGQAGGELTAKTKGILARTKRT